MGFFGKSQINQNSVKVKRIYRSITKKESNKINKLLLLRSLLKNREFKTQYHKFKLTSSKKFKIC